MYKYLTKKIGPLFLVFVVCFPLQAFAASSTGPSLMVIEKSLRNISQEMVAFQGQNQQNWNKFFELQINKRFSASDYPVWQEMQSKLDDLRNMHQQSVLSSLAQGNLFNPSLSAQSSNVDAGSIKLASRMIQQISQTNDSAFSSAVKLPLSGRWHQGLSGATTIQVLKALSAQVAVSNAIASSQLRSSKNQQLLLARVLLELTQLNQNMAQLQTKR